MAKNKNVEKGPGLARGPALIIGLILTAFGLLAIIKANQFPSFGSNFPDGTATGKKFLGFEVNGWTNWLLIVCGGLLLFGSAQHLLAKTMSLIVGLILGAASVILLVDGDDILGLGAGNGITSLGLGIAAAVLLFNTLAPRVKHKKDDDSDHGRRTETQRVQTEPVRETETRRVDTEPVRETRTVTDRTDAGNRGGSVNPADDRPGRR